MNETAMPTDADLLRDYAADRSESAFAELVRRHLDGVYSAALRRVGGDTHLAKDVAQAVFIALARQSRALASHPFLTAWLYATTRNEAATTVRRERRRKTREAVASAMNETNSSSSAESAADWSRLSPVLDDAIDQLSETDRTAILLRYINRRPFAEIGAQLRVTEDAARMRVDRALDKLRTLLAKRGLTSTSAALAVILTNHAVAAAPVSIATSVTLAAIGTIPVTATTVAATAAKVGTGAALSAKAYVSITAITVASLGYFVFAHFRSKPVPPTTPFIAAVAPLKVPRVWPAEEAAVRAFLERHPDVQEALRNYYHAKLRTEYGHIYRELKLTPDEIFKLQSLLCEGRILGSRLIPLTLPAGTGMAESDANAQIRALLGAGRHLVWEQRRRHTDTLIGREMVEDIAVRLVFSGDQLLPPQTARLVQLLSRLPHDWDLLMTEARQFLSPRQLEAFQNMRFERGYWEKSFEQLNQTARHAPTVSGNLHVPSGFEDPTIFAAWRARERASLAVDYAFFYERTRLPKDKREAFEEFLVQQSLAVLQHNIPGSATPTADGAMRRILGDGPFQELQSFERKKQAYWTATLFAAHATLANQSLTPVQADKLAQLIIASRREREFPRLRISIDWKNVEIRSNEFLSSEQQELLKTTEQIKSSRFYSRLIEAVEDALESDRLSGISPPAPIP
jgi:RNA polymerase sigma factor (sigma-70 family)